MEAEARGAQHPGVLYSSLRLKLLAYYSSYEPLSLPCYPALLKLHAVDGPAACSQTQRRRSSGAGWIDEEDNMPLQG